MWITTKTFITFDPVNEHEQIERFMKMNDMTKWTEYPSTVGTTFVHQQTLYCGTDMRDPLTGHMNPPEE